MRNFELKKIQKFRGVFPELTEEQLETGMLYSLGLSKQEIAVMRSVSYTAVKLMLDEIKSKLELYSLSNLLSVFQVRLVLFLLIGHTVKE